MTYDPLSISAYDAPAEACERPGGGSDGCWDDI
uniref:Uncharacterized protein n=1 Tax=Arundo donax TaxID=35708 RepID=A0A0A8YPP8_ARUDO